MSQTFWVLKKGDSMTVAMNPDEGDLCDFMIIWTSIVFYEQANGVLITTEVEAIKKFINGIEKVPFMKGQYY